MAFNKTEKSDAPMRKKGGLRRRKKVCVFCGKDNVIDYKDTNKLKRYVSERGKILPRRITGNCAKHQLGHGGILQSVRPHLYRDGLCHDLLPPPFQGYAGQQESNGQSIWKRRVRP